MGNLAAIETVRKAVDDIVGFHDEAGRALVNLGWKTGRRIVEVEQDGAVRAEYGTGLLQKFSDDLTAKLGKGYSVNNLERYRKFFLTHPNSPTSGKLSWSHYVALLPVEDSKKRQDLEKRAKTGDLSSRQLRKLAQKAAASAVAGPVKSPVESQLKPLRRPIDLALHTCQRVADKASSILKMKTGRVLVDLGFFVCRTLSKDDAARVTITDTPSYTYAVTVERVIDGDTLLVLVDLGFDTVVRERLRLRGINTPELKTPEGDKAKAYVFGFLPPGCPVVIKSHETDDYGRFVADVLYFHLDSSPKEIIESGVYLNQQLLDEGVAVRMAE